MTPYLVPRGGTIAMIIHIRHQNSFSEVYIYIHSRPNVLNVAVQCQPRLSVATVRFGTDFGPDRTIYLTGLDQTNTNRLKKSRSVYNWLLTGY